MTYLRNHCLAVLPMTHDEVNAIYKSGKCPDLCMSHERLRAELVGLGEVWDEYAGIVDRLKEEQRKLIEQIQHIEWAINQPRVVGTPENLADNHRMILGKLGLLESILHPPKTEQTQ